jgi:NADPH-dependent 2,4-dienoyl-CoA reductase/sulfur reductase-like enzyme
MHTKTCDMAVIGGGPAGIAAARLASSQGASVVLIDDAPGLGGHFFKELPPNFSNPAHNRQQKKIKELENRRKALLNSGVEVLLDTRVWGIFDETGATLSGRVDPPVTSFQLQLDHSPQGISSVQTRFLILATGVYDRPLPFPGWELPGVVTPGAVQMLLEKQGLLPGQRVLVGGSGPLQMLVAAELVRHGTEVVALVDTCGALEGVAQSLPALGGLWSRLGDALGSMGILASHRVPMLFRHAVFRAEGTPGMGVQKVVIGKVDEQGRPASGTEREYQVDTICVAYGFIPSIAMTLHLGCEHRYDLNLQAFLPEHDQNLQTSVSGVYVAGDVTGAGGKPLAELQGQMAAIAVVEKLGKMTGEQVAHGRKRLALAVRREKRFASWLWHRYRVRSGLMDLVNEDTLLCRCEAVRMGQFSASLKNGGRDLFGTKLRTRLGMGQCQGRYCIPNAALLIAAHNQEPVSQLDLPSIRPPIVPVRLKDIDITEYSVEQNR